MDVLVRPVVASDRAAWTALRCDLWPEGAEMHAAEVDAFLAGRALQPAAVLVALQRQTAPGTSPPRAVGFAELSLRPYAQGCRTSPVAYLEGWYVVPDARRHGVGAALIRGFEAWAVARGCTEAASDTEAGNDASVRAHLALGFEETPPIRCFRKELTAR